jgi:hypothetical protein
MAAFSLCPHVAESSLWSPPPLTSKMGSILKILFNLHYLLNTLALNTFTLQVMDSAHGFWKGHNSVPSIGPWPIWQWGVLKLAEPIINWLLAIDNPRHGSETGQEGGTTEVPQRSRSETVSPYHRCTGQWRQEVDLRAIQMGRTTGGIDWLDVGHKREGSQATVQFEQISF